jgi:hypothetical protein
VIPTVAGCPAARKHGQSRAYRSAGVASICASSPVATPRNGAGRAGKSCFNFSQPDPELFNELAALTEAGFRDYRDKGYV